MLDSKKLRSFTLCSVATVMLGAGQCVLAHTVIRDTAKEATKLYTAALITHGCAAAEGGANQFR
jgi:hypothetical protein